MVARARLLQARVLPHGWGDVLRQISLFGAAYFGYRLTRGLVEGRATAAFQHARQLISIERTLHLFVEPSVQAWASGSHLVMVTASWMYVNAQGPVTIGALLYLYLRHNGNFYFVRNMFMIAMAIALVGYTVFPTAPPRFMPEWGFIDTVADLTPVNVSHTSASMSTFFNPYAAVPGPPPARAHLVDPLSIRDDVRDRGHRQPLHRRRGPGCADRRRIGVRGKLAGARATERVALLGAVQAKHPGSHDGSLRPRERERIGDGGLTRWRPDSTPLAAPDVAAIAPARGACELRSARANAASSYATA